MQKYEINMDTLAIIPINSSETKIIEKENEYIVSQSSLKRTTKHQLLLKKPHQ